MTVDEIIWGPILTIIIVIGFTSAYWHDFRKTKVKIAICVKCKYCVKARKWQLYAKKISCRTPEDKIEINFVTGTIYKPTFNCKLRNSHGTCPDYKKVWWRR